MAVCWWLWGSLDPLPWVYDEAAYLLQAKIFAGLRWTVPGPALPEFFEQFHVLVTPNLVPKYPPGHALLLVPGVWLGAPALVPLLCNGLTGGLLFAVGRRLVDGWVALLAWAIWITAPEVLRFAPSYMSETTSTAAWMVAWVAALRWRDSGRAGPLVVCSLAAAAGALIRPITAVALVLPVGLWILGRALRKRRVRQVPLAVLAAVPVLALAPWWSYAVSGRIAPTPYSEYSRVYAPWNMPGFRIDTTPPRPSADPGTREIPSRLLTGSSSPSGRPAPVHPAPAVAGHRVHAVRSP